MRDPQWYKDAVIYEVHVRAFHDSNDDGVGDFPGLTRKLPYLRDLGVSCLWLLPFYPSPLRDDGYDIADYTAINPIYGTLDDFRRFVDAAHALDLQVLTELVINHTSDQHPWFQRARRAPRGSAERDFYVWSDTEDRYAGTRIIFTDSERSNWTWDPVAGQYYWHRFFSHQPDLNIEHPAVFRAVLDVMRFWLDLGVDALRLDAIPYLVEREGTINENLPETHAILKAIRRALDREYSGRVLLAEANQWPSDVRAYFGDGDECHMAFHFPLMPRMFMAVRQEERHPIVEIMNQTPELPDGCQWAIFLRNHDELTLEMVTDEERDYMYAQYAADPQMRLNQGIRRRLAPLMENSRPRIELMHSLLFSMPGTPVIYYGDEIGMGDNVYLGDRNGVRTPMQWSSDRNAGFSQGDPARLYFPVIMDPVYGYEAINVDAQTRSPFSLLQWMRRMIALRRQHPVFGRGSIEFIRTENRKVLTYVRRHGHDIVLCVANLSRTVQPVEIGLSRFAGLTPVEMLGLAEFPRITDAPYFLTLAPYGFYWFSLQEAPVPLTARTAAVTEESVTVPALFAGVVWESLLDGSLRSIVERQALLPFLLRQRWFAGKNKAIASARFADWTTLRRGAHPAFFAIVDVTYQDGDSERYTLPLAMASGAEAAAIESRHPGAVVARITGARKGLLHDGLYDDGACVAWLMDMRAGQERPTHQGLLRGASTGLDAVFDGAEALASIARSAPDQTNTSVLFDRRLIMKLFRRLEAGPNPDVEIGEYLWRHGFTRIPAPRGTVHYRDAHGAESALLLVQDFVRNQGNGWDVTMEGLGRCFDRVAGTPAPPVSRAQARAWADGADAGPPADLTAATDAVAFAELVGTRTAELHTALGAATDGGQAFVPEAYERAGLLGTAARMRRDAARHFQSLDALLPTLDARTRALAIAVLGARERLERRVEALEGLGDGGRRFRCHGDYHLGQLLVSEGDIVILDFEGEPARPLAERREKSSPLRDAAGMLRSFSYAAHTAVAAAVETRPDDRERLGAWAGVWEAWVSAAFLRGYLAAAGGAAILPADARARRALLRAFVLDKALYEVDYELRMRPAWVHVPLAGLLGLASDDELDDGRDGI